MRCIICRLPVKLVWGICSQCYQLLPKLISVCKKCGLPLFPANKSCHHCLKILPNWDNLIAVGDYEQPYTKWIYQLKFNQHTELAYPLARLMLLAWFNARNLYGLKKPSIVTCIPLHHHRYWSRGYNQSQLLARLIAHWLGAEWLPYLIKRNKNTIDQKILSKQRRKGNIENVFNCNKQLQGKTIAVIDDIVTTGYTVQAACHQLKQQGAGEIQIICLCRTSL